MGKGKEEQKISGFNDFDVTVRELAFSAWHYAADLTTAFPDISDRYAFAPDVASNVSTKAFR